MYREDKYPFWWLKIILRLIIVLLVVLLSLKFILIINSRSLGKKTTILEDNLKYINNCAKDYFNENNIPDKSGDNKTYKIEEVLTNEQIEYMNNNYTKCDYKDSYIKVTRLDKEIQIKTFISCNNESNYTNTFIPLNLDEIVIKDTTTTKTTKIKVKKTKSTTTKKYKISFNTNGGEYIDDIYVSANETIKVIPKREGYEFVGWYYNGEKFDRKIDNNYCLVAKWTKK